MGKLADRLQQEFTKALKRKVVPISALQKGEKNAASIKGIDEMVRDGHHPLHAIYKQVLNLISAFAEEAITLPPFESAYAFLEKAENLYSPGFPPMSPVSGSYYLHWTLLDVPFGPDQETIGECFAAVSDFLDLDPVQMEAITNLCSSRMGIYKIVGRNGEAYQMQELVTAQVTEMMIPTGFSAKTGDLVFLRVLPPLQIFPSPHVAVTTPYLLVGSSEADWIKYFDRQQLLPGTIGVNERLKSHLKHGNHALYWSEFVFYGYVNFRSDAIFLAGFPDQPHTQPQHDEFEPSSVTLPLTT